VPNKELNEHEKAYIADIRKALVERTDLEENERYLLENEIAFIEEGTIGLNGPDTVEERLERLRNHFP
jgi:hypothetical protein